MHTYVYIHIYLHRYISLHTHIFLYTHIHTYTHTTMEKNKTEKRNNDVCMVKGTAILNKVARERISKKYEQGLEEGIILILLDN